MLMSWFPCIYRRVFEISIFRFVGEGLFSFLGSGFNGVGVRFIAFFLVAVRDELDIELFFLLFKLFYSAIYFIYLVV
jgi:hypothetical protein